MRSILFIRTDRLGETLLNLPAVAALNAAWPDASITLLTHPDLRPLLEQALGVDRVLTCATDATPWWMTALRMRRLLRSHRFDVAMVSNPQKAIHLGVWLARIPRRVGYARKWGRWLLTHRLEDRKGLGDRHEVEYNCDLLKPLGVPAVEAPRLFPAFEREQAEVGRLLSGQGIDPVRPFMTVHPWTSNPAKQWPTERFAAVIESAGRSGIPVAVIGGAEERLRATEVVRRTGGPVADLVGALSLTQLAALLQRAKLLLSNDSGPVHLAAAVGTRTLVLFGSSEPGTGPRRWGPWGTGHTVIAKPSMDAIAVDEVVASLNTLWNDGR